MIVDVADTEFEKDSPMPRQLSVALDQRFAYENAPGRSNEDPRSQPKDARPGAPLASRLGDPERGMRLALVGQATAGSRDGNAVQAGCRT